MVVGLGFRAPCNSRGQRFGSAVANLQVEELMALRIRRLGTAEIPHFDPKS